MATVKPLLWRVMRFLKEVKPLPAVRIKVTAVTDFIFVELFHAGF